MRISSFYEYLIYVKPLQNSRKKHRIFDRGLCYPKFMRIISQAEIKVKSIRMAFRIDKIFR
ncbi:MAG: hypothetical protein A2509_10450 [Candidatus Edwardsbacteria bacterium RIFOXYD12_FULL_50_11]|uniref:Uncharacterized protein n=1 Tax=Candidatus Edwardsbacteria bacterium GWF2_54_11 TaxID=1817851 RepID=A0A1F5RIN2_9BACT|nr:MAG: hypothetical protein A2502_09155 [Candidatus Edwardsbacteria bacterium RifOxyC12_full_54_24]OGF07249.1 MAG: hypothetical protein A2273_01900 [Candidatus Edwardsbacteria bacterium RifOxyA12_full_54_48]OGF09504.1 MAG: hypothetical protein A3K15_08310 [Candidatus Edwardsbacteria bacterium GWE2_54_12]OGF14296.1 MAG: hypothetical protein A2024_11120 [Candidatus Edwardsbacteria bacterium GWF2_54_11]OGF17231.1 MAG: hypothetical protein A2509_10450 [Candidatus Edwardsbacteria bacterium RIFOXYD1